MSNFQPKEGSLSLFKNDKKSSPNAPDWRGNGLFMGKKVKIAAWEKETSKGDTFFSMKIEEDTYQSKADAKSIAAVHGGIDDSDPIPF